MTVRLRKAVSVASVAWARLMRGPGDLATGDMTLEQLREKRAEVARGMCGVRGRWPAPMGGAREKPTCVVPKGRRYEGMNETGLPRKAAAWAGGAPMVASVEGAWLPMGGARERPTYVVPKGR